MKGLTAKEEEIMGFFWEKGPLFVKEMLAFYEEPKPHFNTLSTIVRGLEEKGFLAHYTFGNTYQYYPVVSEEDFRKGTLRNVISKYFNNSYLNAVSSLVKEEDISLDELKQLIHEVEQAAVCPGTARFTAQAKTKRFKTAPLEGSSGADHSAVVLAGSSCGRGRCTGGRTADTRFPSPL